MRNLAWMVLVVVLGWLGALLVRPEVGTELVALIGSQAFAQTPYTSQNSLATPYFPGAPTQPTDPTRPVAWPGTPVDAMPSASKATYIPSAPPVVRPATTTRQNAPQSSAGNATPQNGGLLNSAPPYAPTNNSPGYPVTNPTAPPPAYPQTQAPVAQYPASPTQQYPVAQPAPAAQQTIPAQQSPVTPQTPPAQRKFQGADVLAKVGTTEVVLAHEVLPGVDELMERFADKIAPDEVEATRAALTRQRCQQIVETKLVVAEARKNIPPDNMPKLEAKVKESFEKEQLPKLIEAQKAASRKELEITLKQKGTSLDAMRRAYFERSVAQQWLHQQMKDETEITHEEMLRYYRDHAKEYETEASTRWEHLQASFSKFNSKAEAYQAIAQWGNQIFAGAPFASVAKEHSDDSTSVDGGENPWTTKGSLVSTKIDEAIFGLPPGRLSQIIEDERGFHIVRVMERKEFNRTPFVEAQAEIKKKIREDRQNNLQKDYLEKLRAKTPVWTVFDPPAGASQTATGPGPQTR